MLYTPIIKLPTSAEVPHSKLQWVRDIDSCTQSPGHTVNYIGSLSLMHPFQSHVPVMGSICHSSTTRLWQCCTDRSLWHGDSDKVALTRSLWQGRSDKVVLTRLLWEGHCDRLFWLVALASTSYSSDKHSANFVWLTLTAYSTLDPGTLVVTNSVSNGSKFPLRFRFQFHPKPDRCI